MTLPDIFELVDLLPAEAPYPHAMPRPRAMMFLSTRAAEQERKSAARTDPRFGWKFVMCFVRMGWQLHEMVTSDFHWLYRAYRYEMYKAKDPIIAEALMLDHPRMHFARNVIQACLVIKDLKYEQIEQATGIDRDAIAAYEQLFFNVRDRMEEKAYIASLVYPDHRLAELNPRYVQMTDSGQFLMRLAFQHGLEPMLAWAGMQAENGEHQSAEMGRRLESSIMGNAVQMSRLGLLNQPNVPGLMHARAIITATKQAGTENGPDDSLIGLTALSMGQSVMNSIKRVQEPEVEHRRMLRERFAPLEKPVVETEAEVVKSK